MLIIGQLCFWGPLWVELLAFACDWGLAWFPPHYSWKAELEPFPSTSCVTEASPNKKGDFLHSCSISTHFSFDECQWVTLLNSFSSKWSLAGPTKCCPRSCPLASEWEPLGTEVELEKKTAPSWSGCGLERPEWDGWFTKRWYDDQEHRDAP